MSSAPHREEPAPRALLLLAVVAFGPPAALAWALLLVRPADASVSLATGLTLLLAAMLLLGRQAGRARRGWMTACATLAILTVWPEITLRLVGFSFHPAGVMQFGYPRPEEMVPFQPDPDLFWKMDPAFGATNSLGFAGDELAIEKPQGAWRIVFLGDSCTQQGYPRLVERLLRDHASTEATVEAINLGISGYSSYQGRILAERWIARLGADLVVVYFGWNDHWRAYGAPDAERKTRGLVASKQLAEAIAPSRLLQAVVRLATPSSQPLQEVRVSAADYRTNLEAIGETAEAAGSEILFLTAPSSHARSGVPAVLLDRGFAANAETVIALHREYNEIVRGLGARRGWKVLDLARIAEELQEPQRIFMEDGIHFTNEGLTWVAALIAREVAERFLAHPAPR